MLMLHTFQNESEYFAFEKYKCKIQELISSTLSS